jgi:hypothetical protein
MGGAEGFINVDVQYGEDGKVQSTSVHESKSFDHGRFGNTADNDLRKRVLKAAQRWVFVPERIDGHPLAGSGRVPVQLCFSVECVNASPETGSTGGEPRFAATDPAVKLRSAVAGTAL